MLLDSPTRFDAVEPGCEQFIVRSLDVAHEPFGTAGNFTTDARLAALAMERGYALYSTENDFARFAGLRWVNARQPLGLPYRRFSSVYNVSSSNRSSS